MTASSGFVLVQGGTFLMGSGDTETGEFDLVHTVTVSSFYMGRYAVTQEEYETVMGKNPGKFKGDTLPVENVRWFEAIEYCNKLSVKEGLVPCYSGKKDKTLCNWKADGYRLPTEAEWEYAAKGGGKDGAAYAYSGGNDADAAAWYADNSGGTTHPVGTKKPNSLGIYDMSGNVWEWCWDRYGGFSAEPQTDPAGVSYGSIRVRRGGGWGDTAAFIRPAYRGPASPAYRSGDQGFRLVRSFNGN